MLSNKRTVNAMVGLVISFASLPVAALPLRFAETSARLQQAVEATIPAQRIAQLESDDGLAFWRRRLEKEAPKALEAFGYYNAKVTVSREAEDVLVSIEAGQPVLVRTLSITIDGDVGDMPLTFPLKQGDPLDHARYESGKQAIHGWLLTQGYLRASLTEHTVAVERATYSAAIELRWESGPQFRFGPSHFVGTTLAHDFLQRYVTAAPDQPLTEVKLQAFNKALLDSGYFATAQIDPLLSQADDQHRVPLEVSLTPLPRSTYELGASIGTDRGVGVEAQVKRRRVNRRGHRWEARTEVATERQFAAARYEIPHRRSADRTRFVDLNLIDEQTDSSDRQSVRFGYSFHDDWGGWQRTRALRLLTERFGLPDADRNESTLLLVSNELSRRVADDALNPSQGWRARGALSMASQSLASSTNLLHLELTLKRVGSISERTRWLARGRAGALWTDDFDELPSSLRFYSGGDQSVRGFDFESLGPRDDQGRVLGGEAVAEASLEVDYRFRDNWRVALFADAGNAMGAGEEDLAYGLGLGLRWLSPVGPLRLDVASAISEPGNPIQLHFSAGPDL